MFKPKKQQNYLDMVPIRNITEYTIDGEKITLLLPKFKREWLRKWLLYGKQSKHFRIHLDEMGSKVWFMIDGQRNTGEICMLLIDKETNETNEDNQIELRVTKFLSQLYKHRFIVFKK